MAAADHSDGDRRCTAPRAMRLAAVQLAEMLQRPPDSVSSLEATDEGWTADVEVVEIERIPDTSSVMASYRVRLDDRGRLLGYERTHRYPKGRTER